VPAAPPASTPEPAATPLKPWWLLSGVLALILLPGSYLLARLRRG
jgi:hypothetical protein